MLDFINTDPFLLFFGSFYLVLGLSVFFAAAAWKDFLKLFAENNAVCLITGIITLPISLFIVVFYANWQGIASIVLMVIGYMGLVKAILMLVKPQWMQKLANEWGIVFQPFWLHAVPAILIGLALLVL